MQTKESAPALSTAGACFRTVGSREECSPARPEALPRRSAALEAFQEHAKGFYCN